MSEWDWQDCELVNGEESLSVGEVWVRQATDPDVAAACYATRDINNGFKKGRRIILPYRKKRPAEDDVISNQLRREDEARAAKRAILGR